MGKVGGGGRAAVSAQPLRFCWGWGGEGGSRGVLRRWRWITVTFLTLTAADKDVWGVGVKHRHPSAKHRLESNERATLQERLQAISELVHTPDPTSATSLPPHVRLRLLGLFVLSLASAAELLFHFLPLVDDWTARVSSC